MNAAQLKASILQQAIEGKLVPQLPEEGVVEQIGPAPSEVPFEIPESWKWMSLKSVGAVVSGATPKTSVNEFWNGDINWVTPADLGKNSSKWISHGSRFLSKEGLNSCSAVLMPRGSIVYSSRAPIGHIAIAANELCTNQGCKSFVPKNEYISTEWAYYVLIARTKDIQSRASGTTFKEISGTGMGNTLIPLPPLAEQKRIVAKIEELMPLVEEYGKAYDKLQELNDELPGKLKASILQEAIQGNLVPQLPEDGVVEQIGDAPSEVPFDIPDSWKWLTLEAIGFWKAGATPLRSVKEYYENGTIPWLKTGDLTDGIISTVEEQITQDALDSCTAHINPKGSVLIAMYGATIGKLGVLDIDCATNQACCACQVNSSLIYNWYLFYYLMSQRANFIAQGVGGAQPNISKAKIIVYPIPLPPLDEQKRIVAKIEALFEQIDLMTK